MEGQDSLDFRQTHRVSLKRVSSAPRRQRRAWSRGRRRSGFTLVEVLLVMAVIGILASIATPRLRNTRELTEVAAATADVRVLESEIFDYFNFHEKFPDSLAEIGRSGHLDPWGRPYEYLNLVGNKKGETESGEKGRTNKFLRPINDDFDLYSKGVDGESETGLNRKESADDVIRALSGGYVGLASEF